MNGLVMESRPIVAFSSDGALFAVVSGGGQDICVWESTTSKQLCRVSNKSKWSTVLSLVWAPTKVTRTSQCACTITFNSLF